MVLRPVVPYRGSDACRLAPILFYTGVEEKMFVYAVVAPLDKISELRPFNAVHEIWHLG